MVCCYHCSIFYHLKTVVFKSSLNEKIHLYILFFCLSVIVQQAAAVNGKFEQLHGAAKPNEGCDGEDAGYT